MRLLSLYTPVLKLHFFDRIISIAFFSQFLHLANLVPKESFSNFEPRKKGQEKKKKKKKALRYVWSTLCCRTEIVWRAKHQARLLKVNLLNSYSVFFA